MPPSRRRLRTHLATVALSIANAAAPLSAIAQVSPSVGTMPSPHSHTGASAAANEAVSPLARRLWADLFCMCGECRHITLAECGCDNAAEERTRIARRVEELAAGEDAVYSAILDEYTQRHGVIALVGREQLPA